MTTITVTNACQTLHKTFDDDVIHVYDFTKHNIKYVKMYTYMYA